MRKLYLFGLFFCFLSFVNANNPGYLGISIKDYSNSKSVGVQVVNVFDDGAAKQYGVLENDIITAINNISVRTREDLLKQMEKYNWSDKVHIDFIRNEKLKSTDVYLGYKFSTRTYNVKKAIEVDGELWHFTDDNTEVFIDKNGEPESISKKDANGNNDTWTINADYKSDEVPQYFLDIEDKMYCINRIKEDQAKRNCTIKDIIFIKSSTDKGIENEPKSTIPTGKLNTEIFSISPNPSNGNFLVNVSTNEIGNSQILIFDVTGKIVSTENIDNIDGVFSKQFNLENLAKGAYLLQLRIGDKISTKKILLQ